MAMNGDGNGNGAPPAPAAAAPALITADGLNRIFGETDLPADRLPAAIEQVRKYLGDDDYAALPIPIANEAIIRIIGHGMQWEGGAIIEDTIGPRTVRYPDDRMRSLLKRSGAEALLSPYKTRGVGVIE